MKLSDLTEEQIDGRRVLIRYGLRGSPLVLVLHGGRSSPEQAFRDMPFHDSDGFTTVAYLTGWPDFFLLRHWSVGAGLSGMAGRRITPDDLPHIDAVRQALASRFNPSRTLIAGHSNGGMLALRYAAMRRGVDVATWGAVLTEIPREPFTGDARVRIANGIDDRLIPVDGPIRLGRREIPSHGETLRYFGSAATVVPYDGGHEIPETEADEASRWWEGLPGRRTA